MSTWLFTHDSFMRHDTGSGHPESSHRLRAILQRLSEDEFDYLQWRQAPAATREQLLRVHDADYVDEMLELIPQRGLRPIDSDTIVCPDSGEAALHAAGAVCAAVDAVLGGQTRRAFCAVRPPGHHAEPDRAMGFCLFNNVAVAAAHARQVYHLDRIAVVDFDVHHGNGTQTMLAGKNTYLYASSHQSPLFPGTGVGPLPGIRNVCNVVLTAGTASDEFRHMYREQLLPVVEAFGPQLILISAGFDAHRADPLAGLSLSTSDFAWVTRELVAIAERFANGCVVSTLEGGYDLNALAESVAAHVHTLRDTREP
jgi:acetoin utilization deacetylase AcuC-like enzyme